MSVRRSRIHLLLAFAALTPVCLDGLAESPAKEGFVQASTGRAGFSGTWALNESLSADPLKRMRAVGPGASNADPRRSGGAEDGTVLPWELLDVDAKLLIKDDGAIVRITRPNGHRRQLFGDGEERELDEGEGPAKVTAKRTGKAGEKITVSIAWSTGRSRRETWELQDEPRRLILTVKVKDRESFTYKRVYEPTTEPFLTPTRTPTATPSPAPEAAPGTAPASPTSPSTAAGLKSCSIHPPRGSSQADLVRLAKVGQATAARAASAFVAPAKPDSVISSDVEIRDGCLVWSFLLRFDGKKGSQEIVVDAGDGRVLASEVEN